MSLNHTFKTFLTSLAVMTPVLFSGARAWAEDDASTCSSDDDCAEGSACQKEMWVDGCNPDEGACDDTVHEAEVGRCVVLPTPCSSDDDCGEYEGCMSSETGSCWASSDGTYGCEEPDPDAPRYCAPKAFECETDDDCPREFECTESTVCLDIACAEEDECEPCQTTQQCQPKRIECEDSSACPSDWSCVDTTQWECSGGGATEGDPGQPTEGGTEPDSTQPDDPDSGAEDAPLPKEQEGGDTDPEPGIAPDEEVCEEIQTIGHCEPNAWSGGYYYAEDGAVAGGDVPTRDDEDTPDGAVDNDGSDPQGEAGSEENANDDVAGDEAGCSVSARSGPSTGWLWLTLLAFPLVRRKRTLSPSRSR